MMNVFLIIRAGEISWGNFWNLLQVAVTRIVFGMVIGPLLCNQTQLVLHLLSSDANIFFFDIMRSASYIFFTMQATDLVYLASFLLHDQGNNAEKITMGGTWWVSYHLVNAPSFWLLSSHYRYLYHLYIGFHISYFFLITIYIFLIYETNY